MIIINEMLFTWSFTIFADLGLWTISVQFHMKAMLMALLPTITC